jgi:predicted HTH domain antitoxin
MQTLTLNVPDSFETNSNEFSLQIASYLYERGKLSLGQAAEMVGLSKRTFAELLKLYNVSIFNYPASELSKDVSNA